MQTPDRRLVTEAALETTEAALVAAIGDAADETYETLYGELDRRTRTLFSDGSVDQTARVNEALAAAAGSTLALVGSFTITAPLVIKSDTVLDTTRATVYAESNAYPLLINEHANQDVANPTTGTGTTRDRNITVRGGLWQTGAVNGPNHRMLFNQVDGVLVEDARFITTLGKYCVSFSDVTNYAARRLTFNSASDGVHITGPATRGHVCDLWGTTGDDTVGITGVDYDTYNYSRGSVDELVIERINTTTDARAVLIAPIATVNVSGTYAVRNLTLRDINADAVQGIKADCNSSTTAAVGIVDNLIIEGVSNDQVRGLGLVSLMGKMAGSYIGKVVARGLSIPRETPNATGGDRRYALYVDCLDVRDVTAEMRLADVGTRECRGVQMQTGSVVNRLEVSATTDFTDYDSVVVNPEGSSIIKDLTVRGTFTGGRVLRTSGTSQIQRVVLSGTHTSGSYAIYHTAPTAMRAHFENFVSTSAVDVTVILAGTGEASIDVTGQMITDRSSGPITGVSATKTIRVYSTGVRADASKVTAVAGGELYNTNAALPCGVGPVVCDGTTWHSSIDVHSRVFTSPNGTRFRLTVGDDGALTTTTL